MVQLDGNITGLKEKRKWPLNSMDQLYAQIRDLNFSQVGPTLGKIARKIEGDYHVSH